MRKYVNGSRLKKWKLKGRKPVVSSSIKEPKDGTVQGTLVRKVSRAGQEGQAENERRKKMFENNKRLALMQDRSHKGGNVKSELRTVRARWVVRPNGYRRWLCGLCEGSNIPERKTCLWCKKGRRPRGSD